MKPSNTSERLQYIMSAKGLRQVDLLELVEPYCKKYGVKFGKSALSQYLSGSIEPKQDKLTILSMALGVSEGWLMGYDVPMYKEVELYDEQEPTSSDHPFDESLRKYGAMPIRTQKIPLLGKIACGEPIYCNEERGNYVLTDDNIDADFCLIAQGDSMTGARIYNGDVVFIRKQPVVNNGEIAAVCIGDEATLKRVYYYPEKQKLVLSPENSSFEPLIYVGEELEEVHILGKAVAFQSAL